MAWPVEEWRLRPCGNGQRTQSDRLLVSKALEQHRHGSDQQDRDGRVQREPIAFRQPTRQNQEKQTGQRRGDVTGFDERQRHEAFEHGEASRKDRR